MSGRIPTAAEVEDVIQQNGWWDGFKVVAMLRNLSKEVDRLNAVIAIERRAYERLAICPDHRGKAMGRCVVCDGERRGREEARRS